MEEDESIRSNKRTNHAFKLHKERLSFSQIGLNLVIGSELAWQIIRKHQRHLKTLENPLAMKFIELGRLGNAFVAQMLQN